jgi:hypothetical protein
MSGVSDKRRLLAGTRAIRSSLIALGTLILLACSSQHGSTAGAAGGPNIGINSEGHAHTGSIGMHLTIGNGVHVNALNWSITNGTNTYTGTVQITDDAGNEAQSVEFVAGGIQAGSGYVVTLSGSDSRGDPCNGASATVTVTAGATSSATVLVVCTVPTDASLATAADSGNIAVEAGVVLVNQAPFVCPGITGVSVSPASIMPPETAALTATFTGSSGGTQTLLWTTDCAGASISNSTSPSATFACGSTPGGICHATLTVGLDGTAADGGTVGQVCTGVANTTTTESIACESGGSCDCFPPNVNICSPPCTCVNFQTDPNNCGGCGVVCGAATPVCKAGACIAQPPTSCTSAPCAASGPNSVQCPNSPTSDGVCTPTEATIATKDINAGNLTGGQLNAFVNTTTTAGQGSCYTCLNAKACLDDNAMDTGNECADSPATAGGPSACLTTLNCIISNDCQGIGGIAGTADTTSQENVNLCYCGGANPGSACSASGLVPAGLCDAQEAAGLGFPLSDNTDILLNFGSKTLPSGIANHIFQCAVSNKCTLCL